MKINIQKHIYILFFTSLIAITLLGSVGTAFVISIALAIIFHKVLKPTKQNKVYSQFLSIIFVIIIVITPFTSAIQSDKEMKEEKAEVVSGRSESHNYVTEENSPERAIELATLKTLSPQKIIEDINLEEDELYIEYKAAENLTNNLTKRGIMIDASELMEALTPVLDENINIVNFSSSLPLIDQYGNITQDKVGLITFSRSEWEKINWDNFITDNIESVADYFWIHPAINS